MGRLKVELQKRLVKRILNNDEVAFDLFYKRFFPKVYKYAYRRLKNREQAEDITSETFFKALKGFKKFESRTEGGLDIWMYTIERNVIRDFFRKNIGIEILPFEEVWTKTLHPSVDDPYITIERKEIEATVMRCLEQLPEQYKRVIEMRFFKNMTVKEIATAINKTGNATKVLQFRALKRLKGLVEESMHEE